MTVCHFCPDKEAVSKRPMLQMNAKGSRVVDLDLCATCCDCQECRPGCRSSDAKTGKECGALPIVASIGTGGVCQGCADKWDNAMKQFNDKLHDVFSDRKRRGKAKRPFATEGDCQ